jgi:transposase
LFLRRKKNASGSLTVQIINKIGRKNHILRTIGTGNDDRSIQRLLVIGQETIKQLKKQTELYESDQDILFEQTMSNLHNASIRTVGPELIFGKIYDQIGFNLIQEELFRHLVIARIAFPLSKLKTVEYLYRYQGVLIDVNTIYRFMDKLNKDLKEKVEQIVFKHTKSILGGDIGVVFYDLTTVYFESDREDDLRIAGFNKDGKHRNPQIFIGLLVGLGGYAIGYEIFEGNIFEGHTLIPFITRIAKKFKLGKPIVIADAGLLTKENIEELQKKKYQYIIGARIKNETVKVKSQIKGKSFSDGESIDIQKSKKEKLIVAYSKKRAAKDEFNRKRGLKRLEKQVKSGKLTKASINNKGYNKYLTLDGEVVIKIDYDKYKADAIWDGLKGYVTNTSLSAIEVMDNYKQLWHIEKAFRMSKTDLKVRPVYHRLKERIEAHICISFSAYSILKELERILKLAHSDITIYNAIEIVQNMYAITYELPASKKEKIQPLKMDELQSQLYNIVYANSWVPH